MVAHFFIILTMSLSQIKELNVRMLYKEENIHQLPESKRGLVSSVRDVLESVYPNNYDIHFGFNDFSQNDFSSMMIVIRFPKINIKNSKEMSHTIENLFVKIETHLIEGTLSIQNVHGARTKLTYEEYVSTYCHSHLTFSKEQIGRYSKFCTGSGEINNIKLMFNSSNNDWNLLRLYLLHLNTFVSWESLEGGPYRRISEIGNHSILSNLRSSDLSVAFDLLETLLVQNNIRLPWTILQGSPVPIIDDEISKSLAPKFPDKYLCMKIFTGEFRRFISSEVESISPQTLSNTLLFRGQDYSPQISAPSNVEPEKYLHPQLIKYATRTFKYKAKKYLLQGGRIEY